MLQGKIWGIPVILIALVVIIVGAIYIALFSLNANTQGKLREIRTNELIIEQQLDRQEITPTPSSTPSATPTPTTVKQQFFIAPPARPTGK